MAVRSRSRDSRRRVQKPAHRSNSRGAPTRGGNTNRRSNSPRGRDLSRGRNDTSRRDHAAPPPKKRDSRAPPPAKKRDSRPAPPPRGRADSRAAPPPKKRDDSRPAPPPKRRDSRAAPPPKKRGDSRAPPPAKKRDDSRAPPPPKRRDSRAPPPPKRRDSRAPPPPKRRDSRAPPHHDRDDRRAPPPSKNGNSRERGRATDRPVSRGRRSTSRKAPSRGRGDRGRDRGRSRSRSRDRGTTRMRDQRPRGDQHERKKTPPKKPKKPNPCVWLDVGFGPDFNPTNRVGIKREHPRRLHIELFEDVCPLTTDRFQGFCRRGEYENTPFHRIIPGFMAQSGDFTNRDGTGGLPKSQNGKYYDDENFTLKHDAGKYLLSCANLGSPNTNSAQFFITFGHRLAHLDGKHTVFGQVIGVPMVDGRAVPAHKDKLVETMTMLENCGSASGQVKRKVNILDCGEV